jgi:hypothetical protein
MTLTLSDVSEAVSVTPRDQSQILALFSFGSRRSSQCGFGSVGTIVDFLHSIVRMKAKLRYTSHGIKSKLQPTLKSSLTDHTADILVGGLIAPSCGHPRPLDFFILRPFQ